MGTLDWYQEILGWFTARWSRMLPFIIDLLLLTWTAITAPITGGQENWAVIPALLALPAVLVAHLWIMATDKTPAGFAFFVVHFLIFVPVWWWCVLAISKGE